MLREYLKRVGCCFLRRVEVIYKDEPIGGFNVAKPTLPFLGDRLLVCDVARCELFGSLEWAESASSLSHSPW